MKSRGDDANEDPRVSSSSAPNEEGPAAAPFSPNDEETVRSASALSTERPRAAFVSSKSVTWGRLQISLPLSSVLRRRPAASPQTVALRYETLAQSNPLGRSAEGRQGWLTRLALDAKRAQFWLVGHRTVGLSWRRQLARVLDTTRLGRGWDLFQLAVTIVALVDYVNETYMPPGPPTKIGVVVVCIFTFDYVLRWLAAPRPLRYPLTVFAVLDTVTCLPTYIALAFPGLAQNALLFLRVTRVLRALRIVRLFRFLDYGLESETSRQLLFVAVLLLTLNFLFAGIFNLLEDDAVGYVDGVPTAPRPMDFDLALYFSYFTQATVGYGDVVPYTQLGRASVICFILIMVLVVPHYYYKYKAAAAAESHYRMRVRRGAAVLPLHAIIVSPGSDFFAVRGLLDELYHPSQLRTASISAGARRCVVMGRDEPSPEMIALISQPRFCKLVTYLKGSALSADDLNHAGVSFAGAVFVLSDAALASGPRTAARLDRAAAMRVIMVHSMSPYAAVFVRLLTSEALGVLVPPTVAAARVRYIESHLAMSGLTAAAREQQVEEGGADGGRTPAVDVLPTPVTATFRGVQTPGEPQQTPGGGAFRLSAAPASAPSSAVQPPHAAAGVGSASSTAPTVAVVVEEWASRLLAHGALLPGFPVLVSQLLMPHAMPHLSPSDPGVQWLAPYLEGSTSRIMTVSLPPAMHGHSFATCARVIASAFHGDATAWGVVTAPCAPGSAAAKEARLASLLAKEAASSDSSTCLSTAALHAHVAACATSPDEVSSSRSAAADAVASTAVRGALRGELLLNPGSDYRVHQLEKLVLCVNETIDEQDLSELDVGDAVPLTEEGRYRRASAHGGFGFRSDIESQWTWDSNALNARSERAKRVAKMLPRSRTSAEAADGGSPSAADALRVARSRSPSISTAPVSLFAPPKSGPLVHAKFLGAERVLRHFAHTLHVRLASGSGSLYDLLHSRPVPANSALLNVLDVRTAYCGGPPPRGHVIVVGELSSILSRDLIGVLHSDHVRSTRMARAVVLLVPTAPIVSVAELAKLRRNGAVVVVGHPTVPSDLERAGINTASAILVLASDEHPESSLAEGAARSARALRSSGGGSSGAGDAASATASDCTLLGDAGVVFKYLRIERAIAALASAPRARIIVELVDVGALEALDQLRCSAQASLSDRRAALARRAEEAAQRAERELAAANSTHGAARDAALAARDAAELQARTLVEFAGIDDDDVSIREGGSVAGSLDRGSVEGDDDYDAESAVADAVGDRLGSNRSADPAQPSGRDGRAFPREDAAAPSTQEGGGSESPAAAAPPHIALRILRPPAFESGSEAANARGAFTPQLHRPHSLQLFSPALVPPPAAAEFDPAAAPASAAAEGAPSLARRCFRAVTPSVCARERDGAKRLRRELAAALPIPEVALPFFASGHAVLRQSATSLAVTAFYRPAALAVVERLLAPGPTLGSRLVVERVPRRFHGATYGALAAELVSGAAFRGAVAVALFRTCLSCTPAAPLDFFVLNPPAETVLFATDDGSDFVYALAQQPLWEGLFAAEPSKRYASQPEGSDEEGGGAAGSAGRCDSPQSSPDKRDSPGVASLSSSLRRVNAPHGLQQRLLVSTKSQRFLTLSMPPQCAPDADQEDVTANPLGGRGAGSFRARQ